jgi:alpha-L-fucosidase
MESFEGWNSVEMNQRLRAIQPDIIINNRSRLAEDFGTPEEHINPEAGRDWEACMTFNGLSWGYIDSTQAAPYSYNAQRILRMLATCANGGGNLLLNIGPAPDGSVPPEAIEPLTTVGKWLKKNGEAAYGKLGSFNGIRGIGNRLFTLSRKGTNIYAWTWIWPAGDELIISGLKGKLKSVCVTATGQNLAFTQEKYRVLIKKLPAEGKDPIAGVAVFTLEFESEPELIPYASQPPLCTGRAYK